MFRIIRSYLVQLISFFGVITHFKDRPKWAYSWAGPSQWAVISNGQSDLPHNLSARRHKHIIQTCKTTTEVNLIRCAFKKMYICMLRHNGNFSNLKSNRFDFYMWSFLKRGPTSGAPNLALNTPTPCAIHFLNPLDMRFHLIPPIICHTYSSLMNCVFLTFLSSEAQTT